MREIEIEYYDKRTKTVEWSEYQEIPETWEDLLELCEQIENSKIEIVKEKDTIFITPKEHCFFRIIVDISGDIVTNHYATIAEKRTPAQMWQIIKNLVEER